MFTALSRAIAAVALMLIMPALTHAADCDTDCMEECGACVSVLGMELCPPMPPCYMACIAQKTASCGVQATREDLPFHGNYCGIGNKDPYYLTSPVDELDAACMEHDRCWDGSHRFSCLCDKDFARKAALIAARGAGSGGTLEKAAAIAGFFGGTPCIPP